MRLRRFLCSRGCVGAKIGTAAHIDCSAQSIRLCISDAYLDGMRLVSSVTCARKEANSVGLRPPARKQRRKLVLAPRTTCAV